MAKLENYYIENWSPWLDLKIILKTLPTSSCANRSKGEFLNAGR
ncbi:MAG: sugar transferase [Acidobacteriota bacterium]|nr:MAG: sugar transferase [Acidobacteriota bacterium]